MRTPNRCAYTLSALAAACLTLALTGCGGGGSSGTASTSPTGTTQAPSAETPTTPTTPTTTEPATIPTSDPTSQTGITSATLQWSAPQSMTDGSAVSGIVGYRVYYGKDVMQMSTKIDVMNPSVSTYVVEGLAPGTYYFAVSALHSSGGESNRSNAGMKVIS